MKRLINRILQWVGYHFIGYKVDIINAEITIGKLTSRIDNNHDGLNDKYDDLEQDINSLENKHINWVDSFKIKIDELDERINELEPSELHEMLQTPFNDNDDIFVIRCAELQTKLDEVVKEKNELMVKYKAIRNNINLTNERGL